MLIFYIARQLESTEMQILSSLKIRGKKSISLKRKGEAGWSEGKVINKSNPQWRGAHKTQIQISCKGTGSCAHMSSVCLVSGASAWSHVASGDSPVGSPHTPECMPLNCVLECSFSLLSLAFLHSAFFFFLMEAAGCLMDWITWSNY